jgi:hypothetical protein
MTIHNRWVGPRGQATSVTVTVTVTIADNRLVPKTQDRARTASPVSYHSKNPSILSVNRILSINQTSGKMGRMNRSTRDFYNFALGFALTLLLIHATKLMNAITANRTADQHLYSGSTPGDTKELPSQQLTRSLQHFGSTPGDTKEQPSQRPTESLHQLDINRVWVSEKNPSFRL